MLARQIVPVNILFAEYSANRMFYLLVVKGYSVLLLGADDRQRGNQMLESAVQSPPLSRAEGKQRSRQKLITATINSIAKRGFADTTLARVSAGAGLSRGIVNFHFRSKDALFLEVLRFLSREYQEHWARAFDEAGPSIAEKLEAVLMVDFDPPLSNRNRIAAWFAFYGEAKSRPTYMAACSERDLSTFNSVVEFCQEIVKEGGYSNLDPVRVADGLGAMGEGLWLDCLISPSDSNPELAKQTIRDYLTALFPKHFPIAKRADD
jgi:TetR/AcrR family transcriptional repressor of bet genes